MLSSSLEIDFQQASYHVAFEKSALLFNIAAIYTIEGQKAYTSSDPDRLKLACKQFQFAAGMLKKTLDTIGGDPKSSEYDLSVDNLNFLTCLMLAQAQECFYEKAKEDLAPKHLVQLSQQVTVYYQNALSLGENIKSLVGKLVDYASVKNKIYAVLSLYHVSQIKEEAMAFGEQVAHLRKASSIVEEIKSKKLLKNTPEIVKWAEMISNMIQNKCLAAKKDNDLIYRETVPANVSIEGITPRSMVKLLEVDHDNFLIPPEKDLFGSIVPYKIKQGEKAYFEKLDEKIAKAASLCMTLDNQARNELSALGLPGSIEAIECPVGVPTSLVYKMDAVKAEKGLNTLLEQLEIIKNFAEECNTTLQECFNLLENEDVEDYKARQTYINQWTRTPSAELTTSVKADLAKIYSLIDYAKKSDEYVINELTNHTDSIIKLERYDKEQLEKELPNDTSLIDSAIIVNLKNLIIKLTKLVKKREELILTWRQEAKNDNITSKLKKSVTSDYSEIFEQELNKYNTHMDFVLSSEKEQQQLLAEIKTENEKFTKSYTPGDIMEKRKKILQEFEDAYKNYAKIKNHVVEGITFYSKNQEKLESLKRWCIDFVYARNAEKQDHIAAIQQMNNNSQPNNPFNYKY